MDDGLKQRLIGAVVLVAIAILFLPSLFNQGGQKAIDLTTQVPPEPEGAAQPLEIPLPQPPENARPGKPLAENYDHSAVETAAADPGPVAVVPEDSTSDDPVPENPASGESETDPSIAVESVTPKPPVLNEEGVPRAWSIQVGSFSEQSRADAMLKRLSEEGFERSYIRTAQGANGELHRVFVGPKINRDDALADQAKLNKTFKIKSLLVEFKP